MDRTLGHYDLIDFKLAAAEAYEGVEEGLMSEEDFRDFVFLNPIKLHAGMNPNFFKGTVLEHHAEKALAEMRAKGELINSSETTTTVAL